MKNICATFTAVVLCTVLSACATTGTRATSSSDMYKSMAKSQQAWCSQFGCGCTLDGQPATCSLVAMCVSSGSCQAATQ